jgi:hypothetical protein
VDLFIFVLDLKTRHVNVVASPLVSTNYKSTSYKGVYVLFKL